MGDAMDGIAAAHGPKAAALHGRNVRHSVCTGAHCCWEIREEHGLNPHFLVCIRDKKPHCYLIDSIDSVSSYIPCLLEC